MTIRLLQYIFHPQSTRRETKDTEKTSCRFVTFVDQNLASTSSIALRLTLFASLLLTACASAAPTAILATATPAPVGISIEALTDQAPPGPFGSATPPLLSAPGTAMAPLPTATPDAFKSLTVCLPAEPHSLYEYAPGTRESSLARAAVLEALRDGPIDHLAFDYQPVILEKLPSLKDGDAFITPAKARAGDTMVDANGGIMALANGVHYFDAGGVEQVYSGGTVELMQMTVTFRLRDGLQWEDGVPLTIDDALFAWEIANHPDNFAADRYLANRMFAPLVIDSRTVQWTYLPGFKDTLFYTRFPAPLPRHLYGQLTPAQLAADASVNRRPLSFGPFVMAEWVAGDHITLTKNPKYFRAAEGLPHLDQLIFRFVADPQKMIEQAKGGQCDLAVAAQGSAQESIFLPHLNAIAQAEASGSLKSYSANSAAYEHLDFNINPVEGYNGLAGSNLFQDARVRQAFAHCMDRRALIDTLLKGRGDLPAAYVPPNHPYFDPSGITLYLFDPARGKALLDEAGWKDTDGDGLLDKKGRALSLDYFFGPAGNTLRQSIAAILQTQLRQNCGIEIKLVEESGDALFGDFSSGALFGRRFDLAQFAWVGGGDSPPCGLYTRSEWTGLGDGQPDQYGLVGYPSGGNNAGYINPDFDNLCLRALGSLDAAEKKSLHSAAMRLFSQDAPSILLFFKPKIALARPNVFGFRLDSTQDTDLWNVEALDVTP